MNSAGATFIEWNSCSRSSSVNSWQYQQPQYVSPVYTNYNYVSQTICSTVHKPVCALKNGYKKSYSNMCFARQNGAQFLNSGSCVKTRVCARTTSISCRWDEIKVSPGIDQWGCQQQSYCKKKEVNICPLNMIAPCGDGEKMISIGSDFNGCNKGYKCVKKYNNYNNYEYQDFYPVQNYSSFEVSRTGYSRNNFTIQRGSQFTMSLNAERSGSTITHVIPDGIELLYVVKGNCQQTRVYGGLRLRCSNTDGVQYKAMASYSSCLKKFSTTFSNYRYNNVYKTFSLRVL
jgi:hypothetical protein